MKIDTAVENCAKPFAGIPTDLQSCRETWPREGPISQATRASIALPGIFSRAYIDSLWLVDGGLVNPVPFFSLLRARRADIVIAVDLNGPVMERWFKAEPVRPIIDCMNGIRPEFFRRLLNQIPAGIRKQATAIAPRLLRSAPDSPSNFDMLAKSINIMQDHITRSRLAAAAQIRLGGRLQRDRTNSREDPMKLNFRCAFVWPAVVLAAALFITPVRADSDLARAYRVIAGKRFVDLTHSFGPETPVWSGFGQAVFTPAYDPKTKRPYTIKQDGFRTTYYNIVGQYGTHVDPPAHFADNGVTMDEIPLKQMILPLIVLDDTPYLGKNPNHAFSIADLWAWEKKHGRVPRGSFVALRTDMYKDWDSNPERFKRSPFPAWAFETIKFLYEKRGVTATGHEAMDTDNTDKMDSETYILQHGHYQIEVMANLDRVPPKGALIVVSWPKVRKGLGFPARAFAILP